MPRSANSESQKKAADDERRLSSPSSADLERIDTDRFAAKKKLSDLHDRAKDLIRQGKYRQAFEAYAEYGDAMSKIKGLIGAETAIVDGARKFGELRYWNEAGNLYLLAANFLTNMSAFSDAGEFYLRAAEALEKAKDAELMVLTAACYAAGAHAFREAKAIAESDRALMKGVIVATGKNPLEVEGGAFKLARTGNFEKASKLFSDAASIYLKGIDELSGLASTAMSGPLTVDIKSILHHRAAQDFLASGTCLSRLKGKSAEIGANTGYAASNFTMAVINFTPLFSLGEAHKEDYRRYSYDLMMGTALRIALGSTEDVKTFEEQLTYIDKKRTKVLEESKHLAVARMLMSKYRLDSVLDDLREINFGSMQELKEPIIDLLGKLQGKKEKKNVR